MTEQLYYIQSPKRYIGNSLLWWKKDSRGYTVKLDEALLINEEEMKRLIYCQPGSTAWKKEAVDSVARLQVDMGDLRPEPMSCQTADRLRREAGQPPLFKDPFRDDITEGVKTRTSWAEEHSTYVGAP